MSSNKLNRIVFHSKEDMSAGYYLEKVEELLNDLDINCVIKINDLLELYHVKMYFDNELFLIKWDELTKNDFKLKIDQFWINIRLFFQTITDENLIASANDLEFDYKESFWELFNYFQIYKKIQKNTASLILENHPHHIRYILLHEGLINHFDDEIRAFLIDYKDTSELLLSNFEQYDRFQKEIFIFPRSLSLKHKEDIISKYIDSDDANLNYIRLIEHSKDSTDLKLSAKVRLKAKKKSEELNERIFEDGNGWKTGVQVTLSKDQIEPVIFSNKDDILEASYSETFLDERQNNVSLFLLFRNLFLFTDSQGIISLYNKEKEMGVFEKTLMKSKNEYSTGMAFFKKSRLSDLQIIIFNHYLNQKNKSVEILIKSFIEEVVNGHFNIPNLRLGLPSNSSTFLEKIRILAPELESLLKQYDVYTKEGEIDFDLIQIDPILLNFSKIKSLVDKKYGYLDDNKAYAIKYHFFSDQSSLFYTELFKSKYTNFYDLLTNEDVKFEDFEEYQKTVIGQLISEEYLFIDDSNNLKIKKQILISVIGDLHKNEVISYWHYPEEFRKVIDEMVDKNLIKFESTLLSKQENNYFNYYLNKKGYTNGLNIRNKYLHGTNTGSEKEHQYEYNILIKLVILTLLKIADDLILRKKSIEIL